MSSMELAMILTLKDLASSGLGKFNSQVQKTSSQLMAMGQAGKMLGQTMIGYMQTPIGEFAQAENAATQLKVSMMGSTGAVSEHYEAVNKLATGLGGKLPGTVKDFQRMMTVLNRNNIEAKDVLGGVGEAAGYLAVQLEMPFDEAAKLAAKLKEATGTAAADMFGLMDTIQRTVNLGVDPTEMRYAFGRSAGAMKAVGMQGLQSAQSLSVMYAQLIKTGLSGETVGTNMATLLDGLKKFEYDIGDKASSARKMVKDLGLELKFFDKAGNFVGPRQMIAQFEQLKKLAPGMRAKLLDALFGGGQDGQMVNTLMLGGVAAYDEMDANMRKQADLRQKVDEQLGTLLNVWEAAEGAWLQLMAGVGASIAPELKMMAEWFGKLSGQIDAFTQRHPQLTKIAVAVMAIGGGALVAGGTLLFGLGAAISIFGPLTTGAAAAGKAALWVWGAFRGFGLWQAAAGTRVTAWLGRLAMGIIAIPGKILGLGLAIRKAIVAASLWARLSFFSVGGWAGVVAGIKMVAAWVGRLALTALTNPLGWIVLAAIFIYKYWEPIKGFFSGLWSVLKQGLQDVGPVFMKALGPAAPLIEPIIDAVKGLWGWFKDLLNPVRDTGGAFEQMGRESGLAIVELLFWGADLLAWFVQLPGNVWNALSQVSRAFWDGVYAAWVFVVNGVKNAGASMMAWFYGLPGQLYSIGMNMLAGLLNGLSAKAVELYNKAAEIANGIKGKFKGIFGINSPSRVFHGYGMNLGQGLRLGMDASAAYLARAANQMATAATPTFAPIGGPSVAMQPLARAAGASSAAGGLGSRGMTIHYAPNITVAAGAPAGIADQLQPVLKDDYETFTRNMRRWMHDRERSSWS